MGGLQGKLRFRLVSARPEAVLNKLSEAGVMLLDISYTDALTVEIQIHKNQSKQTEYILKKQNADYRCIQETGVQSLARRLVRRPVMLLGIILFTVMAFSLPSRILFVAVSGNSTVPENRILEVAEDFGIGFGGSSKEVRSEEIKNQIMATLPELQWVGITTSGCVANIQVQERSQPERPPVSTDRISNIVSVRDATVTGITVQRGTPLITVGQSVKAGDLLVSGYSDYGLKIVTQSAQAEITGYTVRSNTFLTPVPCTFSGAVAGKHTCFRLRIGKKVINFCNHSGIPDGVCVKMYSEDYLSLPGGFQLPVSLTRIESLHYAQVKSVPGTWNAERWLPDYAQRYLRGQMVAGQILGQDLKWMYSDDCCQLWGIYACHEMIGQMKYEEIMKHDAEDY